MDGRTGGYLELWNSFANNKSAKNQRKNKYKKTLHKYVVDSD